jgi:hypothetical protein
VNLLNNGIIFEGLPIGSLFSNALVIVGTHFRNDFPELVEIHFRARSKYLSFLT